MWSPWQHIFVGLQSDPFFLSFFNHLLGGKASWWHTTTDFPVLTLQPDATLLKDSLLDDLFEQWLELFEEQELELWLLDPEFEDSNLMFIDTLLVSEEDDFWDFFLQLFFEDFFDFLQLFLDFLLFLQEQDFFWEDLDEEE